MTADTQAQGDLVKLAEKCGAQHALNENDAVVLVMRPHVLEAFAAALQGRGTQEGEPSDAWAELWYFVMDEAPMEFERIVTTFSPKVWHQEAHKLMRAKYPYRAALAQAQAGERTC